MSRGLAFALALVLSFASISCSRPADRDTLVMIIEASPTNLDPRIGTDAQSERIGMLLFDSLVHRDEHFNLQPWLAEKWEIPDPKTYIFHLRPGVRFHNGQPLTARDVKWTFDSLLNSTVISARASSYKLVERVDAPDDHTVIFHLKDPFSTLLWNLSDGAMGIVPYGSGKDFNQKLIGSGPFKFVSAVPDSEVVIARNDDYWAEHAHVPRVRFAVVPDSTTRALELRKGSADIAINAMSGDVVLALSRDPNLQIIKAPGTIYAYLAFNLRDSLLKDARVRQAIASAIDRDAIIKYLWHDMAAPAAGVLPREHWAYTDDVAHYAHDPARARALLDAAGYRADPETGVRFHLTMKTSTEETSRLMAAIFQQQLRDVGIALDIRSYEFATFYSDVVKGAFQLYSLRWIGGNEDPDIFEHVFHSASFPPKRANRSYYVNPRVDTLIDQGRVEIDLEKRKAIYAEIQRIIAADVPYVSLWYFDNVLVHNRRVRNLSVAGSGNYNFLRTAEIVP